MSINHCTKKSTYSHLSASERGAISAYLKIGKKPAEIARLVGRHRSTISRELKRGEVTQVQDKNRKLTYYTTYFADSAQRVYETKRRKSVYHKLNDCSKFFFKELEKALKTKPRATASIALCRLTEKNIHWKSSLQPRQCIGTSKTDY